MRLNKYIAHRTVYSRRAADGLIAEKRVHINGRLAAPGEDVGEGDTVSIDGEDISAAETEIITIMLNKPRGYVCSRRGQGSRTIYELLPEKWQNLNSVGRLDKDSSGLLLLTNDGELADSLTHPRYQKVKIYEIELNKPLAPLHQQMISDHGVMLEDGVSKFEVEKLDEAGRRLRAVMHEGRNRQIRRTFEALGYNVTNLHRTVFGDYTLDDLPIGKAKIRE